MAMRSCHLAAFLVGALAALWTIAPQPASAQSSTVLTGTFSLHGTRTDCNPGGSPTPWSETGTFTITLEPPLPPLVAGGGTVSGTANATDTVTTCSGFKSGGGQPFDVNGTVSPGGAMTLTFSDP